MLTMYVLAVAAVDRRYCADTIVAKVEGEAVNAVHPSARGNEGSQNKVKTAKHTNFGLGEVVGQRASFDTDLLGTQKSTGPVVDVI